MNIDSALSKRSQGSDHGSMTNPRVSIDSQDHYKLKLKSESFSRKGFGNGFVSKANRFSGINESKFLLHMEREKM